jgi:hypothetical protein
MRTPHPTRTAKSARARRTLTLLGVLILLALAGWAVVAVAGPKVATPTITSGPSGATSATGATFGFVAGARGDTLECSLDGTTFASCASPKAYSGLRDGAHTFRVRERTSAGQVGDAASRGWTVDTRAPPAPTFLQKPADPSTSSSATLKFADGEADVAYLCQLDGAAYAACSNPVTYNKLADGAHLLSVKARDAAGNVGAASAYGWRVQAVTKGEPFAIAGGYDGLLYPGTTGELALRVSNPNKKPILVTSLTVTIQPGSSKAGCDGPRNLQIAPSNVSEANPLSVPANGSVTLPSGSVSAPRVTMLNLSTNQDACKGAVFSFVYSGSSHS